MAVKYGYFNSIDGDRTYNADDMSEYFDGLVSNGVYESVGGALQVTAGSGMSVNVATGRAIINCKWISNNSVLSLNVTAAHAVLNRYTAVVVRLDIANRLMTITTKDGTPASSPVKPSMTNNSTIVEICLAYIYVGAGVTSITQANITDMRPSSICGWVTGLIKQVDTSQLFLQWQNAYQNYYDTMTQAFNSWFETLTSQLKVETYISDFHKYVKLGSGDSRVIPLDMAGYEYEPDDIFFIAINGLVATEAVDWLLDTRQTPVELHVNTVGSTNTTDDIDIKVLKSAIGFTQLTGSDGSAVVGSDGSAVVGGDSNE